MTRPLPPLRNRLQQAARDINVPINVVELDYGLSYVLLGLFSQPALRASLVFKGGTALHKVYFADYRFSVDLDFTARGGPRAVELENLIAAVASNTQDTLGDYGPFAVTAGRRPERSPHPFGQEAFQVEIRFPWQRSSQPKIKIEITVDEPLMLSPEMRPLLHRYGEILAVELPVYRLEEIVAEKLRTPLQAQKRVDNGSWPRNCARDYYDLWQLLEMRDGAVDLRAVLQILPQKCAVRQVTYRGPGDFFPSLIVSEAERQWQTSLAELVKPLPDFPQVIDVLRKRLEALLT